MSFSHGGVTGRRRATLRSVDAVQREVGHVPVEPVLQEALRLSSSLRAFLERRGHGDEARDLVQDLFVLLLSRPGGFVASAPGPLRSLLFAVAWRIGANATRRRRPVRTLDGVGDELPVPDLDPEARVVLSERVRRAAAALDSLAEGTRRALLLVADEGMTTAEAARALGISEEALRARLCRGRRRIAQILEEDR
jgi:RNA polymerase sigma-70 factor (ECF subfamily)